MNDLHYWILLLLLNFNCTSSYEAQEIKTIELSLPEIFNNSVKKYLANNDSHILLGESCLAKYNDKGELLFSYEIDRITFEKIAHEIINQYSTQNLLLPNLESNNVSYYCSFNFISNSLDEGYVLGWQILLEEEYDGSTDLGPFHVATHLSENLKPINHYPIYPPKKNFQDNNQYWDSFMWTSGSYFFSDVALFLRVKKPFENGDPLYTEYKFEKGTGYQFNKYSSYNNDPIFLNKIFRNLSWRSDSYHFGLKIFSINDELNFVSDQFEIYSFDNLSKIDELHIDYPQEKLRKVWDANYSTDSATFCACIKLKKEEKQNKYLFLEEDLISDKSKEYMFPIEIGSEYVNCSIYSNIFYIGRYLQGKYHITEFSFN